MTLKLTSDFLQDAAIGNAQFYDTQLEGLLIPLHQTETLIAQYNLLLIFKFNVQNVSLWNGI